MHRLVIALTTLVGLTGATYLGYHLLVGATSDRAATLVPANAAAYVNVYLEPSAGQRMNLSNLIGQLPGFADEATLDEKVDEIVQNLLAGTGIDYRADVKSWLGGQVAAATWFEGGGDAPTQRTLLVAAVRDEVVARDALDRLVAGEVVEETYRGHPVRAGERGAFAIVGGMAAIGDAPEAVHAAIDAASGDPSLAGRAQYRDALAELPTDHLASAFVDIPALVATASGGGVAGTSTAGPQTAAAVLIAERDGLRLVGRAAVAQAPVAATGAPSATDDPIVSAGTLAGWMPETTVVGVTAFGLTELIHDAEAAAATTPGGEQLTGALDTLRAVAAFGLGINLDDEVLPLLAGEVGVAVYGLDGTLPRGQLLIRPDDAAAALATLDRIVERLTAAGGDSETETVAGAEITVVTIPQLGEVAYGEADGVLVLGLSAEDVGAAIDARASGSTLASTDAYEAAFGVAGERIGHEGYLDVTGVAELLGLADTLPADGRDILSRLGSLALVVEPAGNDIEFRAALTLDEQGAE